MRGFMKIKITLILSLFLLLCACAENVDQSVGADHTYLPDSSMSETPVTGPITGIRCGYARNR